MKKPIFVVTLLWAVTAWAAEPAAEVPANPIPKPDVVAAAALPAGRVLVDAVRVYERALNADEVRALYEATK